jgi:hypothetical protein
MSFPGNPQFDKSKFSWPLVGCLAIPTIIVLASIIFFGISLHNFVHTRNVLDSFRHGGNCVSGASVLTAEPPCYRADSTVLHKESYYYSRGSDQYYLVLQVPKHKVRVRLIGHRIWDDVALHDLVSVQIWHGQVVLVSSNGYNSMTSKHPQYLFNEAQDQLESSAIPLIIFALITATFYIIVRYQTKKWLTS